MIPRRTLFVPHEKLLPIPISYIDILRNTTTDLPTLAEKTLNDYWIEDGARELSGLWTGRTRFMLLKPKAPDGSKWVDGRITKIQKTTRPDSVWPETWKKMSQKVRKKEIKFWESEKPRREAIRTKWDLKEHVDDDDATWTQIISDAKSKLMRPAAPAMPLVVKKRGIADFTGHTKSSNLSAHLAVVQALNATHDCSYSCRKAHRGGCK